MRQDQFYITLTVNGIDYGVWDDWDGGEVEAEETKYRPGGSLAKKSYGGPIEVGNVTLARVYDVARDHAVLATLEAAVGSGECVATRLPVGKKHEAIAGVKAKVVKGILQRVQDPTTESDSSEIAKLEVEISTSGLPVAT